MSDRSAITGYALIRFSLVLALFATTALSLLVSGVVRSFIPTGVSFVVAVLLIASRNRVLVGSDGILIQRLDFSGRSQRYVAYGEIGQLTVAKFLFMVTGVTVLLKNGEVLRLKPFNGPARVAPMLVADIERRRREASAPVPVPEPLPEARGYREPSLDAHREALADVRRPAKVRIAAAEALLQGRDEAYVAEVIDGTVDPALEPVRKWPRGGGED